MGSFKNILEEFKDKEEDWVENVAPLTEDAMLRSGLVAWKSVPIVLNREQQCPHEDEAEKWNWLWEQVQYDLQSFQAVAGVKMQDVGGLLTRLKGLRLIYPDGTINDFARKFLQAQILAKLSRGKLGNKKKADKSY